VCRHARICTQRILARRRVESWYEGAWQPLSSVMELENFRKSLGDEHARIIEHTRGGSKLGLDASWVLFEDEDEKDGDAHKPRSKAPRIRYHCSPSIPSTTEPFRQLRQTIGEHPPSRFQRTAACLRGGVVLFFWQVASEICSRAPPQGALPACVYSYHFRAFVLPPP
jgi:hypothetical protein